MPQTLLYEWFQKEEEESKSAIIVAPESENLEDEEEPLTKQLFSRKTVHNQTREEEPYYDSPGGL